MPIVYQRTIAPEDAPDRATYVEIGFEKGDAVSIDGEKLSPPPYWRGSMRWARPMASGGWIWWKTASSA